jgi:hypothetical protein
VNNLCNRGKRRINESYALDQYFQCTVVALVREFRLKHVEAQFIKHRLVAFRRHKLKARGGIDKAPNEPGACHAVHVNSFASDPGFTAQFFASKPPSAIRSRRQRFAAEPCFNLSNQTFCCLPAGSAKKINANYVRKTTLNTGKLSLQLYMCVSSILAFGAKVFGKAARLVRSLSVFSLPSGLEQLFHLIIRETLDKTRLAESCFSTPLSAFP